MTASRWMNRTAWIESPRGRRALLHRGIAYPSRLSTDLSTYRLATNCLEVFVCRPSTSHPQVVCLQAVYRAVYIRYTVPPIYLQSAYRECLQRVSTESVYRVSTECLQRLSTDCPPVAKRAFV